MATAREHRRRVGSKAAAIARDIRNADFPEAVQIVAKLVGARAGQKRREARQRREESDIYDRASEGVGLSMDRDDA